VEVNHRLDLEVRLENLVVTGGCLSSNEERVLLYDNKRESRDCAGLVMNIFIHQENPLATKRNKFN